MCIPYNTIYTIYIYTTSRNINVYIYLRIYYIQKLSMSLTLRWQPNIFRQMYKYIRETFRICCLRRRRRRVVQTDDAHNMSIVDYIEFLGIRTRYLIHILRFIFSYIYIHFVFGKIYI